VYDGTWNKDANRRRRMTPGFGWVFGFAIRVKVAMGGGRPASRGRQENTGIETHARDQNRNEVGFRDATS